uniref:SCP domain-containing protein n=1 Tax=Strongyloides papillosus TaxID=174720 RepID=A0A0N5C434_STREA
MNFLSTIVIYIIVIISIAFVLVKANTDDSDDENEPIISRRNSDTKVFVKSNSIKRKNSKRKTFSTTREISRHKSNHNFSKRRSSTSNKHNGFDITPYLKAINPKKTIHENVWGGCNYRYFCDNEYRPYISRVISEINYIRISFGVPILKESKFLSRIAKNHAKKMSQTGRLSTEHSKNYGLNVGAAYYESSSSIVTRWYEQRYQYSYGSGRGSSLTSMFTQLVWKDTAFMGVGVSRDYRYLYLAVCFYPRGNIEGLYKKNVFKKISNWYKIK